MKLLPKEEKERGEKTSNFAMQQAKKTTKRKKENWEKRVHVDVFVWVCVCVREREREDVRKCGWVVPKGGDVCAKKSIVDTNFWANVE
jgi:hypothetical protein